MEKTEKYIFFFIELRLWGPPNLLYDGYWGLFPGGKAAGAWS
jgi:hypothetical protein